MQTSRILVLDSGKIAIIFVLVTASLFLASGPVMYSEAHEALNVLPARSNFDGEIYMRTYLFMREGHGYYDSLLRAIQLDERYSEGFVPGSVLAWRQPALHYIFVLLPSADDIYALYLVLALVAILSSYVVAYRSTGQPLLSAIAPILIANYFASPVLAPRWLVFHEWWGALFLIFALSMVSLGRDSIGVTFLVVAACIREFFFIALLGGSWLASFAGELDQFGPVP